MEDLIVCIGGLFDACVKPDWESSLFLLPLTSETVITGNMKGKCDDLSLSFAVSVIF